MKSRVQKKEMRWEKLDNTANLFPVIANETMTNVYRIAVILSERYPSGVFAGGVRAGFALV